MHSGLIFRVICSIWNIVDAVNRAWYVSYLARCFGPNFNFLLSHTGNNNSMKRSRSSSVKSSKKNGIYEGKYVDIIVWKNTNTNSRTNNVRNR